MRRLVSYALFPVMLLAGASASAQQPGAAPPRDPVQRGPGVGSAVVRGRVLAGDTGRPLRRTRITLVSPELGREPRVTSSGLDGRYEFTDLPAGRYTMRAERGGYLTLRYGQTRPLEQGSPLDVREGQAIERVDFTLPRAGAITGRVVDELGEPVADVQVFAMRTAYWRGRRRLVPAGMVGRTDDAGEYRVSGLMPGSYLVMAVLRETWIVREGSAEQTFGYAPTYAPATAVAGEAQRLTLRVGERLGPIDLSLVAGRAASVSGIATDAAGRPLTGRYVGLGREVTGPESGAFMSAGTASIAADGRFSIKDIPPGQYSLRVQTSASPGSIGPPEMAVMPISIDGVDLTNVRLTTSPGWSIAGQILTEDGTLPQTRPAGFAVSATPVDADVVPDTRTNRDPDSGRVLNDWSVRVSDIYGVARLQARVPEGWWVKSIVHDGRDLADAPAEMRSGEALTGVRIVVSNRPTSISGRLTDDKGAAVTSATVVAFARDSQKWFEGSRWVRAARPDQQGNYRIEGLPPGEYTAVAVDYVEDGAWNDAAFIESLGGRGAGLTLAEGEARTLTLKLATP